MRVLTLDAALARCSAAVVANQDTVALRQENASRGHAALLPVMVEAVLDEARQRASDFDLVAVTVGPGSFTGIRAGLALAHGIGRAASVPVVGVSVGEALADSLPYLGARELWSVVDSRRNRIFLERGNTTIALALTDLPQPSGRIAVAGDAAPTVAAWLAARDVDVMLTDARIPQARHIAVVAEHRHAGRLPPRPAQPLYVDPPEAKLPAGGLRPAPAG
ncbi:MAG TPA: tRNA (adenosine(37)-N6)-threonylcarbamoyltransferase complex dimerization subunit type 1 TsaB [Acetobacteraceae bacterium]|nr:tRNA (adenosine(37)-N6)-threonylcarbamoyltransferase complex dimerization subunit type 1 TsaB [Acetobacteraceae bacterium]